MVLDITHEKFMAKLSSDPLTLPHFAGSTWLLFLTTLLLISLDTSRFRSATRSKCCLSAKYMLGGGESRV